MDILTLRNRITAIRELAILRGVQGYIIHSKDEYQNEYVADYAKRLEYITGFSGSNGVVIILQRSSLFFTDSRYFIQARQELQNEFEIHDISKLRDVVIDDAIGYDPALFTKEYILYYPNLNLHPVEGNLVDEIWVNKPSIPHSIIYRYPVNYSGETTDSKISIYRKKMHEYGARYSLITAIASICWLLNIRASDIEFSPVMLSYLVITDISVFLCIDRTRCVDINDSILHHIDFSVEILFYDEICDFLKAIDTKVLIDKTTCPIKLSSCILHPLYINDICAIQKACKNKVEIATNIDIHIKDACALIEAISIIYAAIDDGITLTEYDIGLILTQERSKQVGYISDSFAPIVAYQEHGAIVHYRAPINNSKPISNSGILLMDSGAHYFGGTTDVTRVISIGHPTHEQKQRYTEVLKGHIALASQVFPSYVTGANLDILARMYLWRSGYDYGHGTGHGVGNALFVHEGPHAISMKNNIPLREGMIVSNEPGYYKTNEYGIRIENLMAIERRDMNFLHFYTLTLVPYCSQLIDLTLLSKDDIKYLEEYYNRCRAILACDISDRAREFLQKEINFIYIN